MKKYNNENLLIFLHIYKTGGLSFSRIVTRQFSTTETYSFSPVNKKYIKSLQQTLQQLPNKERLKLLEGHLYFNVHENFPRDAAYITFLRHPVERIISQYYFERKLPQSPVYYKKNRCDLLSYISNAHAHFHNFQLKILLPKQKKMPLSVNQEDLETVKKNIADHFAFVGITERFDESLLLMKKILGWQNVYYNRRHTNKQKPNVCKDVRNKIEQLNVYDMELYRWANDKINNLASEYQDLSTDLENFSCRNKIYGPIMNAYDLPFVALRRIQAYGLDFPKYVAKNFFLRWQYYLSNKKN